MSIFTGKTRNWSGVPGASASGTIDLISRTSVAGVLTSFQTLLLEGKKVVEPRAAEESSEGLLRQEVESDPNAIGFLSNYQADKGGVNAVGFNGVACNKIDRRLRPVRRRGPLLRGDQRQGHRRRVARSSAGSTNRLQRGRSSPPSGSRSLR